MLKKLWKDENGAVSVEYLFLLTIVGLGMVIGYSNLSNALNAEYTELGNAILGLSQGYEVSTRSGCSSTTQGSRAVDQPGRVTFAVDLVTPAAINQTLVGTGVSPCPEDDRTFAPIAP